MPIRPPEQTSQYQTREGKQAALKERGLPPFAASLLSMLIPGPEDIGTVGMGQFTLGKGIPADFVRSALESIPFPWLAQYLRSHPMKVPIELSNRFKGRGFFRYETAPNMAAAIQLKPQIVQQGPLGILRHEMGHTGQYLVGGSRGVNQLFPGTTLTPEGVARLLGDLYRPRDWPAEVFPMLLEEPWRYARIVDPSTFQRSLEKFFGKYGP